MVIGFFFKKKKKNWDPERLNRKKTRGKKKNRGLKKNCANPWSLYLVPPIIKEEFPYAWTRDASVNGTMSIPTKNPFLTWELDEMKKNEKNCIDVNNTNQ